MAYKRTGGFVPRACWRDGRGALRCRRPGMAFSGLGGDVAIGSDGDILVAELQQAINRVIVGASKDSSLPQILKDLVHSDAVQPVAVTGILGDFTNLQFRFAKNLSGVLDPVTLTTMGQVKLATTNLNAAADAAGYARTTNKVVAGAGASGGDALDPGAKGFSTVKIVAIGGVVLVAGFLLIRSSR